MTMCQVLQRYIVCFILQFYFYFLLKKCFVLIFGGEGLAKRVDVVPTLKKVKCYTTNYNSFFLCVCVDHGKTNKGHHGKIMEFDSGKLLGTLFIRIA